MLRRYAEQILNLYNYIDGVVVVSAEGIIEYFITYRPDVNNLKEKDLIGRHVLDIYPNLTAETSSILRVLKSGKPIFNEFQVLSTYYGQSIKAVNTTMPIKKGEKIVGAVEVSRYIDFPYERQDITLELKKQPEAETLYTLEDIVTNNPQMERIKERIKLIADTDSSVLLYGETGTGKELAAQSIHTCSRRRKRRFVSQNCAAIPANLLESILFGTVKGSYTGAENRPGLFELANGGTLFLDEINSMETSVQAKLLKAIEEKKVKRIGASDAIPVEVKIVSAVNQNPMECIKSGSLREDLFFRLSVVQLTLPPLRERINDLLFMVNHFIAGYNGRMNRNILGIDETVEHIFRRYSWPGNVRELKNIIEGAFNVTSSGFIQPKDLPEYLLAAAEPQPESFSQANLAAVDLEDPDFSLNEYLAETEVSLIRRAMAESGSLTEAAKKLKISKQALNYKLDKYNISR